MLLQSASATVWGKGMSARPLFTQVMVWSGTRGVETKLAPSPSVIAQFTTGHDDIAIVIVLDL